MESRISQERTKEVMDGELYRLEIHSITGTLNEENFDEVSKNIIKILEVKPKARIPTYCSGVCYALLKDKSKIDLYLRSVEQIINSFPGETRVILRRFRGAAATSRILVILYSKIIQLKSIKFDLIQISIGNFFRACLSKFQTYQSILIAMTLYFNSKELIDLHFPQISTWIKTIIPTFLSYFQNPQADFFLKQFKAFVFDEQIIEYEWDNIFKNDDDSKITEEMIQKSPIYFLSVFSYDKLLYPPTLISGAAFNNANKCVEKMLKLGCNPDELDIQNNDMFYYAGTVGNVKALDLAGRTPDRLKNFVKGAIQFGFNDLVIEMGYFGPFDDGETILHLCALYNNYQLMDYVVNNNICSVNEVSDIGDFPQHNAARKGSIEALIRLSYCKDFDINAKNMSEVLLSDLAAKYLNKDLAKILENIFETSSNITSPYYVNFFVASLKIQEEGEEDFSDDDAYLLG
ncbi:hypothetical protein TVAG_297400 [Trichomonas vaginalis G3]|uniref:Uncharacterized protein n=1 Tax=Trichomonas vaginalis (strain ATCC PRA-98 / G3) TaxID=412133 RepID=A2DRD5_TRIV3|nr:Ankyrin repeat family [Trichomonas vaginalis G3]EAY17061.1 hypothetical protein TVAG_297400 [Trichomonas vaginalis G3]KAI5517933.1 Ankyrin repeat family [Trichomonas vaginalis G3]|eukprot:XP_001329284.1 hypothetical protein [Trichomonas vaginalis G3]